VKVSIETASHRSVLPIIINKIGDTNILYARLAFLANFLSLLENQNAVF